MFTNLIESSSHAKEFKRRGSFLLFTTATYIVLFVVAGVVSIHAYDARLEEQSLELVVLLPPQEFAPEPEAPAAQPDQPRRTSDPNESNIAERAVAMLDTDRPESVGETVSTKPNTNLPLPDGRIVRITGRDYTPESGDRSGTNSGGGGRQIVPPRQVVEMEEPPPAPEPPRTPKVISKGPITGQAVSLPQPAYPPLAKQMGIQGLVNVQVLIDEQGRVMSATAVSGSPFLTRAAQQAALQARFSPTTLGNQPVRVSGVITYNFVIKK